MKREKANEGLGFLIPNLNLIRFKRSEFGFVWIFAIIVGGAILALAIYGAVNIGISQRFQTDTMLAQKISILLDPMQAGFADATYGKIEFKQETRIDNKCYSEEFGKSKISLSTRSRVGEEWLNPGVGASNQNKYIFSEEREQGKDIYVFSKPFEFPYKVADMIFMSSKKYCFIEPPTDVKDEVLGLKMENIEVFEDKEDCSEDTIKICFDYGFDCDITVYGICTSGCSDSFEYGYVEKDGEEMDYVEDLMYGAIFSDKNIYDCNVQRMLYRAGNIAEIYGKKADLMNARRCNTGLKQQILSYSDWLSSTGPEEIISLKTQKDELNKKNRELCGLW